MAASQHFFWHTHEAAETRTMTLQLRQVWVMNTKHSSMHLARRICTSVVLRKYADEFIDQSGHELDLDLFVHSVRADGKPAAFCV
jgi:hypothetical protein